jgi:hypothetical protein
MSSIDPIPRKTGLHHIDLFVGGCALLVSVVSLFIAWQANRTQERMLAASVWPYISWGTDSIDRTGRTRFPSTSTTSASVRPRSSPCKCSTRASRSPTPAG